jgi:hypothetical protein
MICSLIANGQKIPAKIKYKKEYDQALHYCKVFKPKIDSIAIKFKLSSEVLLPIIFPELIRYSVLKDKLESASLELLYTNLGKEYSDFSVGYFQMKPSFVEKLEESIKLDSLLCRSYKFAYTYPVGNNENAIRMERISRLESLEWQIIYLCLFFKIIEKRFSNLLFSSSATKINFYSTAYNVGFWKSKNEIVKWQKLNTFPSGKIDDINNYPYGLISFEYFITNSSK